MLLRGFRFGRPARVLLVLRDLTQPRRMQQELRRNERLATLGQLSAGVAHEIRNPLAGIGVSAQVLLGRFEPRDARARFVSVILEEVARLDRLVTNLLQYARPRSPELSPGQLVDCVRRVVELSADSFARAGVRAEVEAKPGLRSLWIDTDLVTQVVAQRDAERGAGHAAGRHAALRGAPHAPPPRAARAGPAGQRRARAEGRRARRARRESGSPSSRFA